MARGWPGALPAARRLPRGALLPGAVLRAVLFPALLLSLFLSLAQPAAALGADPAPGADGLLATVEGAPPAPALRLSSLGGEPFVLDAARSVAVVHFFATWCEPCRTELPALARFAARSPQLDVILVDVAEVAARVQRFLAGLPGADRLRLDRVLMDPDRAAARAWDVSLLPATFVVAGGRLVLAREGEVAWDDPETGRRIAAAARPLWLGAAPAPARQTKNQEEH